jgi:xanthine dehydrogenase large subunit
MSDMHVVGRPAAAAGAPQIVTGQARYVGDLPQPPGTLAGRLLYAAHPCARIARLDVTRARALPGVAAVLTAGDVPGENSYLYADLADQPLLTTDRVRW